jgi:hypothetical protein
MFRLIWNLYQLVCLLSQAILQVKWDRNGRGSKWNWLFDRALRKLKNTCWLALLIGLEGQRVVSWSELRGFDTRHGLPRSCFASIATSYTKISCTRVSMSGTRGGGVQSCCGGGGVLSCCGLPFFNIAEVGTTGSIMARNKNRST